MACVPVASQAMEDQAWPPVPGTGTSSPGPTGTVGAGVGRVVGMLVAGVDHM